MQKKYELLEGDCLRAGARTVYRIRALRDFPGCASTCERRGTVQRRA
jgi:hypothetical protein